MSDNLVTPAQGTTLRTVEIAGVHHPVSIEIDPAGHLLRTTSTPVIGTFTATGSSTALMVRSDFNVTIWGTFSAVYQVERSFDNTNWHPLTALGTPITFNCAVTEIFSEPEFGVRYRLTCTSYMSGTINYRISQ